MKHYKKNFRSFVTLFNVDCEQRNKLLGSCEELEHYHFEKDSGWEDWSCWEVDDWRYTKCPCGNGMLEYHYNYLEGCGSDWWIGCSCKKCSQELRNKFPEDVI